MYESSHFTWQNGIDSFNLKQEKKNNFSPNFSYITCRDEMPKSMYWAVGLVRGRLVVRGQLDDKEGVRIIVP